jgi:ELWxxDGT repeat protein
VKDIPSGGFRSYVSHILPLPTGVFFVASDEESGLEPWFSDGTEAGTVRLRDINPGTPDGIPGTSLSDFPGLGPVVVGDVAYFAADDGVSGVELWRSDGTTAGTFRVKDIATTPGEGSSPRFLTAVGVTLYFVAADDAGDRELWKSDGTEAGTVPVADIDPTGSSSPADLVDVNGRLFFTADDGTSGRELWVGDAMGTRMVTDLDPTGSSNPEQLTAVGDEVFFSATAQGAAHGLFVSDGTDTHLVVDPAPGDKFQVGTAANGILYFRTWVPSSGKSKLWRSDGQTNGTFALTGGSEFVEAVAVTGRSVFS